MELQLFEHGGTKGIWITEARLYKKTFGSNIPILSTSKRSFYNEVRIICIRSIVQSKQIDVKFSSKIAQS